MAYYNWEEIFKKKSDNDLNKIISGQNPLSLEAELFAAKELIKRGYPIQMNSIKEKVQKEMNSIESKEILLGFSIWKLIDIGSIVFAFIMFIYLIISYLINYPSKSIDPGLIILFGAGCLLLPLSVFISKRRRLNKKSKLRSIINNI
jgi:hypothetical protein